MESILTSIKKLLGIAEEYKQFDSDIVMHINSVLVILNQLGVGPENGFSITDDSNTWADFTDESAKWELIKSYVYLKVKLIFDPPPSSVAMQAYEKLIGEFESRLLYAAESN